MAGGEGGRGWSLPVLTLQTRALDHLEGVGPAVPFNPLLAWGEKGAKESSHNHEGNAWTGEALRALLSGTAAEQERALDVVERAYFDRELAEWWGPEQFAPAAHDHQELAATSVGRVVAVRSGRPDLLEKSGRLLRNTVGALKSVATPDLEVWSAGMRPMRVKGGVGYLKPVAPMSTAWLRMVIDGNPGLPALSGKNAERAWRDPYFVCLRALRWLQRKGDDLGGAATAPIGACRVRVPMEVHRGDDAHLVKLLRTSSAPRGDVCHYLLVSYQRPRRRRAVDPGDSMVAAGSDSGVTAGFDWQGEPPPPPRSSYVIRFPGRESVSSNAA